MNQTDTGELKRKAATLVRLVTKGPGQPLVLTDTTDSGLSSFLEGDLSAGFRATGLFAAYIDCRSAETSLLTHINSALEHTAVDVLNRVQGRQIDLVPFRAVEAEHQMGAWIDLIHELTTRSLVLILDGLPEMACLDQSGDEVASLRATLTTRRSWIRVIFGSYSDEKVRNLFGQMKAPMYQFATLLRYPSLILESA